MAKARGQSGVSIADTYEIPGGVFKIGDIDDSQVNLTHDLASTVFAERFQTEMRVSTTGSISQNTSWANTISDLPGVPTRLLGLCVHADVAARITRASVVIQDADTGQEIPIFFWDITTDIETQVRMSDAGGLGVQEVLQPTQAYFGIPMPTFVGGSLQVDPVCRNLIFRGTSAGFGAGSVECILTMYIAHSQVSKSTAKGLPVPSW